MQGINMLMPRKYLRLDKVKPFWALIQQEISINVQGADTVKKFRFMS